MLPADAKERKATPIFSGVVKYFPRALAEVARVSKAGNDQHNPGQPLHWDKTKSADHGDCLMRHQMEAGKVDVDGMLHSAKVAWRALAQLEMELDKQPNNVIHAPYCLLDTDHSGMCVTTFTPITSPPDCLHYVFVDHGGYRSCLHCGMTL